MSLLKTCPEPALEAGGRLYGFKVLRVEMIPELRITAYEMEHERTGAKVLHLHCHDPENLYAIGFRTPPFDSTGVPHILEHAVLAGSERYPLKDAFNELLKGTLQTFINAFTYPDKTIYPVASQTRADFFNLARVYTDLVLRPRLLPETFQQEGHHLEFVNPEDGESDLTVSGIVYNEMKGAYSSPDSLMYKAIQENLYPDNTYACDSGGDPDDIPSLTYGQFKAFHRRYYSPTNARIFLYGDIPTVDQLRFLEDMLAGFDRETIDSAVQDQSRWSEPRSVRGVFPIGSDESPDRKASVNVAWMLAQNTDHETATLLAIVAGLLVGSAAGPLRKALIDSGYGQDLSPVTGMERDLKQIAFAVGLRGTETEMGPQVEALILKTLRELAEKGFDRELIEGTLHQIEFQGKEIVRKTMPYGITLMGRAYHAWLYDGDPLAGLNFPRIITDIRKKWDENPALFQDAVRTWFLDNPHRLLSVMIPSRSYQKDREEVFRRKMDAHRTSLSKAAREDIRQQALALKRYQSEPDLPEAAATLPRLKVADLPRSVDVVPTKKSAIGGLPVLQHDLFTNGIAYLDLVFDISDLPEDMLALLPLLGKLTLNMGAAGFDYEGMAKRIALKTGGLGFNLSCGRMVGGQGTWQKMIVSVKALHRNIPETLQIVLDLLTKSDLSDESRMRDLIVEKKNRLHASVVPSGHLFAKMAAAAALSVPAYRDEQWHGRTQFRTVSRIADAFPDRKKPLREALFRLQERIFRADTLILNMTADTEGLAILSEAAAGFVGELAHGEGRTGAPVIPDLQPVHAGIAVPAEVCYVAEVLEAPTYGDPLAPYLMVMARYLSSDYLYKRIRVQGGAYGGMSQYDPLSGLFTFLSYRDPHIVETFKIYEEVGRFLGGEKMQAGEIEKALIGTIGALDRPMDPSGRGYTALIRDLAGLSDQCRQDFRDRILSTTAENIHEAADRCFSSGVLSSARAVFASEENLRRANEALKEKLIVESLVPSE